jgi:hypothetical protein
MKELDGVCEECGNTGIVGEICSNCGTKFTSLDENLDEFDDLDDDAPAAKSKKHLPKDELEALDEFSDDIDDPDADAVLGDESLEQLAADENEREGEESDLATINRKEEEEL